MKARLLIIFTMAMMAIPATGFAGEAVQGSGPTRSAAADDANKRAADESQRRFKSRKCYTPAKIESCKKTSDGDYICTAYVANHEGSCK